MAGKNKKQLVVVTTGGSGGHIFPAEAISAALLKKGYEVAFITDARGKAFQGLSGVEVYRLSAEHVMGRSLFNKAKAAVKLGFGVWQALRLLKKLKPVAVIGVGGYASIPAVMAAHLWHIPVILHEQNSVLGRANRLLGRYAKVIATSFKETVRLPVNVREVFVGLPVRPAVVAKVKSPYNISKNEFNLLIFGGSQGASFFSHKLADALLKLPAGVRKKIALTQQVRAEDMNTVQAKYKKAGFKKQVLNPFFSNMPDLLVDANLIIGRSGASTVTEAMVVGRPCILFPLPTSADNHQMENARQFCDGGGGWLMSEPDFDEKAFVERLEKLIETPELLKTAAMQSAKMGRVDAADKVAGLVDNVVRR